MAAMEPCSSPPMILRSADQPIGLSIALSEIWRSKRQCSIGRTPAATLSNLPLFFCGLRHS